jgi:PAS domain S-box-containing protein
MKKRDGTVFWAHLDAICLESSGIPVCRVALSDITGRKHAEEALWKSEEKFRVAQELSPDGFTILRPVRDTDGKIVDFTWLYENDAIARLNGTDPKAVIGQRLLELFPGHQGTAFFKSYTQVAETGEPGIFEAEYGFESMARPTWFRIVVVRMDGDIAILAQDITERKKAEQALRKSEEKYRLLFENMTEMFQILEPLFNDEGRVFDFRYIKVNKATEVLAGKKREEMEGRTALELFGFVEDYWLEMIERALNTREPVHLTEYSKAVDLYYDVNAWKESEDKVAIVFSNITENKRDEKALRASEERMRVLVNCIPDEVWFAEKDKIVTLVNPAVLREFGEALHGVRVEKIASSLEVYRPDGSPRPIEEAPLLRALSGEVVRNQEEIIRIPARDELRYRQVNASPVIDAGGYIIGSVTIARDITEQKKAEEALRESGERHAFLLKLRRAAPD